MHWKKIDSTGKIKLNLFRYRQDNNRDFCITLIFAQFWSLRGAKRRGNLVDYQYVLRLLRFARNDNTGVVQRSIIVCVRPCVSVAKILI